MKGKIIYMDNDCELVFVKIGKNIKIISFQDIWDDFEDELEDKNTGDMIRIPSTYLSVITPSILKVINNA
jgi:hypothetical protein